MRVAVLSTEKIPQKRDTVLQIIKHQVPKGMVFTKDRINLSRVVGQGMHIKYFYKQIICFYGYTR